MLCKECAYWDSFDDGLGYCTNPETVEDMTDDTSGCTLGENVLVVELAEVFEERVDAVRELVEIQGADGNWNANEYMRGLYNGLELALSVYEERKPRYKERKLDE